MFIMYTGYEHLTDEELLREVYAANTRSSLEYELAKRLDRLVYGQLGAATHAHRQMDLFDGDSGR